MSAQPFHPARTTLITSVLCAVFVTIAFSLYRIQILQYEFFVRYAQHQYTMTLDVAPARGCIYDRTGQPLALNTTATAACLLPGTLHEMTTTHALLQEFFPHHLPPTRSPGYVWPFTYLSRDVPAEVLTVLREQGAGDIQLLEETRRFYPLACCSPFLGTTDIDTHGIAGLELMLNDSLQGTWGSIVLQRDARGQGSYFHKHVITEGHPGCNTTTTIDAQLQFIIAQELEAAAHRLHADDVQAVVVNPQTGEILALAQYPWFDNRGTPEQRDPSLLAARALTQASELGSVMKAFSALAALDEGVVTPDELIDCRSTLETTINGMPVTTTREHGIISFTDVVRLSNNIGTAQVALRLGKKLYTHYRSLGFGDITGIELPGEQSGSITPPRQWSKATPLSLSYGYELRSTLIQLAQAFSVVATDGLRCAPHLLTQTITHPQRVYEPAACRTLKTILDINAGGMKYLVRELPGYTLYGKTGTAKVYEKGGYRDDYNLFTFVGCLEHETYQRVIVVHVRKTARPGEYASTVAAPLWATIAQRVALHDGMTPHP